MYMPIFETYTSGFTSSTANLGGNNLYIACLGKPIPIQRKVEPPTHLALRASTRRTVHNHGTGDKRERKYEQEYMKSLSIATPSSSNPDLATC